jgi:hypothetical protein
VYRCFHAGQQLIGPLTPRQRITEPRLVERGPQGPCEIALGQVPLSTSIASSLHGTRDEQAARRIEQPRGRQLGGGRGPALKRQVQRGPRGVNPGVQPVKPSSPPRDVDPEQQKDRDDGDKKRRAHCATPTPDRPSTTVS